MVTALESHTHLICQSLAERRLMFSGLWGPLLLGHGLSLWQPKDFRGGDGELWAQVFYLKTNRILLISNMIFCRLEMVLLFIPCCFAFYIHLWLVIILPIYYIYNPLLYNIILSYPWYLHMCYYIYPLFNYYIIYLMVLFIPCSTWSVNSSVLRWRTSTWWERSSNLWFTVFSWSSNSDLVASCASAIARSCWVIVRRSSLDRMSSSAFLALISRRHKLIRRWNKLLYIIYTTLYYTILYYHIHDNITYILYIQSSIVQHYIIISMTFAYVLLYIPIIQLLYNIPYGTIYTMLLRLQYSSIILYNIPYGTIIYTMLLCLLYPSIISYITYIYYVYNPLLYNILYPWYLHHILGTLIHLTIP